MDDNVSRSPLMSPETHEARFGGRMSDSLYGTSQRKARSTVHLTVKGGVIMYRRGGGERPGVALQNRTTRRLL